MNFSEKLNISPICLLFFIYFVFFFLLFLYATYLFNLTYLDNFSILLTK